MEEIPVVGELLAQSPETHCDPVEQVRPVTRRHWPLTSDVPDGHAHVCVSGSHANGEGHEHEVEPRPDVAPAGQAVQGGCPLVDENVLTVQTQLPLASRAEEAGQEATQTFEEHAPLAQSAPDAQIWLFLSKHVALEATKPLVAWMHLQVLSPGDHAAPLPTGQLQELAPVVVEVEPPPQATQGVRPLPLTE